MKIFLFVLMISSTTLLAACGSDPLPPVSKGQQINDLQNAYKSRAITADVYKDEKEKVLDQ